MRRPDAATRSISRVRVDAERVRLDYEAVAWGDGGPLRGEPRNWSLPRAPVSLLPKRATAQPAGR